MDLGTCPLCGRELVDGPSVDRHHLVPRSLGGKDTILIHKICHQKIHSCFTERELKNGYSSIDAILSNEEIQKFVKWVKKKDPEYYDSHKDHSRKRRKK